jgi:hypothetical protein
MKNYHYAVVTRPMGSLSMEESIHPNMESVDYKRLEKPGIYVIRWITMYTHDIAEYTELCLKTWPRFEVGDTQRCYGVFRSTESTDLCAILMLTWYENLSAWERSRQLDPRDRPMWVRRSQMELSHWAEAGRLAK